MILCADDFASSEIARDRSLNWPLLALIALIPLQNIYLGKLPSLGGGINVLNVLMLFAFFSASALKSTTYKSPLNRYLIALMLCYLMSLLVSALHRGWDQAALFAIKDTLFAYGFYFLTYKSLSGVRMMNAVIWATVIPLPYMFKVFQSKLSWMGFSSYSDKLRLNSGTFMELGSNEIAAFYATYTFMVAAFVLLERDLKKKLAIGACALMNLYCLVYGFSRGAYLAALVGVAFFCWVSNKTRYLVAGLCLVLALVAAGVDLVPQAVTERFSSSFAEDNELDESAQTRLILWSLALDEFKASPVVGIGYGSFRKINEFGLDTHNYYMKLLCEGGAVSFTAFMLFLLASYKKGLELLRIARTDAAKKVAGAFLACTASLAVGNYFGDRFTHYPLISYYFVYLAIVVRMVDWSRHDLPALAPDGFTGQDA